MIFKRIYIVGAGYVGLANGLALAENTPVTFIDNNSDTIEKLKNNICPILENDLQNALLNCSKNITASNQLEKISDKSLVILSLPTNYDEKINAFDTSIIENVLDAISRLDLDINILIKSTIPIGFTDKMIARHDNLKISFSPEFLREGNSYNDMLHPDRIIFSPDTSDSRKIASIFSSLSKNLDNSKVVFMNPKEAETVKLFSNTYLAMRVAFFNEIDSFCLENVLDSKKVIQGLSKDSRIGEFYNNPSFGYGGYCLPKDVKQSENYFNNIPSSLIHSISNSNNKRIGFIADKIIDKGCKKIGFYKLSMKSGSDNSRESSTLKIIDILTSKGLEILIYEQNNLEDELTTNNIKITADFKEFLAFSEIIIANRIDQELEVDNIEIFTRDIFHNN